MNTSNAYGALPILGKLWDQPALYVLIFSYFIDFGVICALMGYEQLRGAPTRARHQFLTFIVNDTLIIPPFLGLAAYVMHTAPHPSGFYTSTIFHWLVLVIWVTFSIGMELLAVKTGGFTVAQELSPSKFYHTLVFGIMGYWLTTGAVAAVTNWSGVSGFAVLVVLVWLFLSWTYVVGRDNKHGSYQNAHCEWSWRKLRPVRWPDD